MKGGRHVEPAGSLSRIIMFQHYILEALSRNLTAVITEDHQTLTSESSRTEIPAETLLVSEYFSILVWAKVFVIDQNVSPSYLDQCLAGNEGSCLRLI